MTEGRKSLRSHRTPGNRRKALAFLTVGLRGLVWLQEVHSEHWRSGGQGAPLNGGPFLEPSSLKAQKAQADDAADATTVVDRLNSQNQVSRQGLGACDLGDKASKNECMAVAGRECMWINLLHTASYCLPCEVDGIELPCWNVGAKMSGKTVSECQMRCPHQKRIRQPEYTCADDSGFITASQCMDKGARGGSKCMHISYDTPAGGKAVCAPCRVQGSGTFGCPAIGVPGPGLNSKVASCVTMCDEEWAVGSGPGVVRTRNSANEMMNAPFPISPPSPPSPQEVVAAALAAANAHTEPPPTPADVYYPVVMYRTPKDYLGNGPGLGFLSKKYSIRRVTNSAK